MALLLSTLAAGCSVTARPGSSSLSPAAATSTAITPSLLPSPSPSTAPGTTNASVELGPPVATLAAEGGDPINGQLGTFVWGDSGSDAPWLPGARIAVGSGEPLTVRLRPAVSIAAWRARMVPSTADGPAGVTVLGEGSGDPLFEAPEPGTWTVEVHVLFANGVGGASYFWRLAVD